MVCIGWMRMNLNTNELVVLKEPYVKSVELRTLDYDG